VTKMLILNYLRSLGLFRDILLGTMSTSMVLAWDMGIPAFNATKLQAKPNPVAGGNGTFVPFSPPRDHLFAHTAFFPTLLSGLFIRSLHLFILLVKFAKSNRHEAFGKDPGSASN